MKILLAIDPGQNTGWAYFWQGKLSCCGLTKGPNYSLGPLLNTTYLEVVIERPLIYRPRLMKGDPNDLIVLALLAGRFQERALAAGAEVKLVTPVEWKGSVPKEVSNSRTLAKLRPEEKAILDGVKCAASAKHNVVDALGIGIWRLGR